MENIFFSFLFNIKMNWLLFLENCLRNPQLNFSVLIHCRNIGFLRYKDRISKNLPKYRQIGNLKCPATQIFWDFLLTFFAWASRVFYFGCYGCMNYLKLQSNFNSSVPKGCSWMMNYLNHAGFWGEASSTIDWCEANYAVSEMRDFARFPLVLSLHCAPQSSFFGPNGDGYCRGKNARWRNELHLPLRKWSGPLNLHADVVRIL